MYQHIGKYKCKIDLTLLVLVRDRQYNLNRLSNYYKDLDCVKIICDSSVKPYQGLEFINSCGFNYIYFGPIDYWDKIYKSTRLVDTEYIIDHPDDDIITKESILQCVEFLDNNKDYNVCQGEIAFFTNKTITKGNFLSYAGGIVENFYSEIPNNRLLFNFLKCPLTINHSLCRSKDFKEFYETIYNNPPLKSLCLMDRLLLAYMSLKGNRKTLPILSQLRERDNERVWKNNKVHAQLSDKYKDNYQLAIYKNKKLIKDTLVDNVEILKNRLTWRYYGNKDIRHVKTNINNSYLKFLL